VAREVKGWFVEINKKSYSIMAKSMWNSFFSSQSTNNIQKIFTLDLLIAPLAWLTAPASREPILERLTLF
jgi:hypothetical protein